MVWVAGKGTFTDFLFLFPAAFVGWIVTAYLLSRFIPAGNPPSVDGEDKLEIRKGGKVIMALFSSSNITQCITPSSYVGYDVWSCYS